MKVGGAARRKTYDPAYRPRRIGLRSRDPREGRQRGSAGCQMQKLPSAGKFHFEPPFTSFDHLVGEREQLFWNSDAERSRYRQVDDQIEFGWLLDREIGRLRPAHDFVHIVGRPSK